MNWLRFAQFASDLDDATRKQLERGRRVTELLKQPQYQPLQVWQLAASLYAVNNGFLDNVDVKDILPFEKGLHDHLKTKFADLDQPHRRYQGSVEGRRGHPACRDRGFQEVRRVLTA